MIPASVFLFGLFIGSFLNVCIVRLPRGRSIVAPPSHCPRCQERIKWYDNIPVVSFFILRGRCRNCGLPISWRYPAVEIMNGFVYLWAFHALGLGGEAVLVMALCSALIVITFIDLDHQVIPDVITLPGMLAGLTFAPFFMSVLSDPLPFHLEQILPIHADYLRAFLNSLIGLVIGAAPLLGIGWLWEKLKNVEAMGGGDIKLMGMVGSFIGWKGALLTIMIGALAGSLVGGALILLRKHQADKVIPFGPFLAVGAAGAAFYGPEIISWYLGLVRP
jgi:leader peptidase (prepilin peptidase)/N-methyltransferase